MENELRTSEIPRVNLPPPAAGIAIRTLGPLKVSRNGSAVDLPSSRKARALLAYLAAAPLPVSRSRLCELLGDIPNDPRGDLRWCLSKIRGILDGPERRRVRAVSDVVSLDLDDCFIDIVEIEAAMSAGIETLDLDQLRALSGLFAGEFLEGLDLPRSPQLDHWLVAQRRRYRACHAAVLEQLTKVLPAGHEEALVHIEKWVQLSPFDARAQIALLKALATAGQFAEGEHHLNAVRRLFQADDSDFRLVQQAWKALRGQHVNASRAADAGGLVPAVPEASGNHQGDNPISSRSSLAVMPFAELDYKSMRGGLADGLTHDIITRLAKLRSLFVIARGSVFALSDQNIAPGEAGRILNADYVASGIVKRQSKRVIVSVDLVEARTARIVWSDTFDHRADDAFLVLDQIGDMIVSSIAIEIETAEKNRAILKPPNSLNAWEAYHRGLWHMYRFTKSDNEQAQHFLELSSKTDPTFARAHAGLSFTHWQNAFQQWADRERETELAYQAAGRSLVVDDHDPAAHLAMGRALWLRRCQDESLVELERAVELSPNLALGHYSLSFVHTQSGDPSAAIMSADHSRHLSPFDPLLFGMLAVRAIAHVRLGQFEEGAEWALKAAARPNAHVLILAIAAHCLALAGRVEEGRAFSTLVRKTHATFGEADFQSAFKFSADAEAVFRQGAKLIGWD